MPDLKISQLTAATTPLDGTEVLPIVQAGTTDQVTVANLTAGRAISATSMTVGAGTAAAPSLTTSGDTDTGVYFPAANTVGLSVAGAQVLKAEAAAVTSAQPVVLPAGTAGAPALTTAGDLNTGVVFSAADTVGVSTGGTQRFTVDTAGVTSTLPVVLPAGTVSAPGLTTTGDLNTGVFFPAADTVAITEGGTEVLRVTSTGRVGIGQTSPATKLDLTGAYAGNSTAMAALDVDCSAGNYFTKTINGASTFTVSNVPASRSYTFTLELEHTSGAITWFSGVEWPGGTAPTLTTGKTHLFMFQTDNGGTRWRASSLINYTT